MRGVHEGTHAGGGILGRYGGEEFVLLLPGEGIDAGMACAERIRTGVATLGVASGEETVRVTISIGVACCPGDGREAEALLRAADRALYRAKGAGRNRVERADTRT